MLEILFFKEKKKKTKQKSVSCIERIVNTENAMYLYSKFDIHIENYENLCSTARRS